MQDTLGEQFGPEFETGLLHLLLFDKRFAEQAAAGIEEDLFEQDKHREIAAAFVSLVQKYDGAAPSYAHVKSLLHDRQSKLKKKRPERAKQIRLALRYMDRLREEEPPDTANQRHIEECLSDFVTDRKMEAAYLQSIDKHREGKYEEAVGLLEEAVEAGRLVLDQDLGFEYTDSQFKLDDYDSREEADMHAPTGIPLIDKTMRGGLEPKHLGIMLAGTGVGKTMALTNIGCESLLAGLNVVHITLEISAREVAYRYDARMTGFGINEIMGNLDRHRKTIRKHTKRLQANLFIKEWGSDEASGRDIRSYLKMLEARTGVVPDVVLVDYADLLRPINRRTDLRIELGETMRALRQISKDWDCAVWTASQTNREGWDVERISLKTISESAEKAMIADVIVALCQTSEERRKHKMRMIILKNRQGGHEGHTVDCKAWGETQLIEQAPQQLTMHGLANNGRTRKEGKSNRRKMRDDESGERKGSGSDEGVRRKRSKRRPPRER